MIASAQASSAELAGPTDAATAAMPEVVLPARLVAVGLPGVQGVRQVGRFHSGGPIPGNPEFLMRTQPGRVLDPQRLLVAVTSNLGAPRARADHAEGAVLSIDPQRGKTLIVAHDFASAGTPSSASDGAVQLYTAQTQAFANARYNPKARTAALTAAAGPRYLSINNAFGRPWIANAPTGLSGAGSVSVVDPDGAPLQNPPSSTAGGVFAGDDTARATVPKAERSGLLATWFNHRPSPQLTPGALNAAALGTAFLGPSPDGSGLAVFAVATADGALAQVHVQDGVDGLAPPGSWGDRGGPRNPREDADSDPGVVGMAFKWNPQRALYVADAARNRIVLLHLGDDTRHFTVSHKDILRAPEFRQPVDLAPTVPEIANPRFASHTTLAGGADLYVANRGDGSVLRIDQQGRVLARARIVLPQGVPLAPGRLRALAVSADAQRLWLTLGGDAPGHAGLEGALIEVPAFDAAGAFANSAATMPAITLGSDRVASAAAREGQAIFTRDFTPAEGLGPLFNARSCVACHFEPTIGGTSSADEHFAVRVAHMDSSTGRVQAIAHPNSPVARRRSAREWGDREAPSAALPPQANVTSLRMPSALYPVARLDEIPDAAIEAHAVAKGDGIKGRVNRVVDAQGESRVGRYGWKAAAASLESMVAEAFANELGVHSALSGAAPQAAAPIEDDGRLVRAVAAFVRSLRLPGPNTATRSAP